jgi:hypothetical protein
VDGGILTWRVCTANLESVYWMVDCQCGQCNANVVSVYCQRGQESNVDSVLPTLIVHCQCGQCNAYMESAYCQRKQWTANVDG